MRVVTTTPGGAGGEAGNAGSSLGAGTGRRRDEGQLSRWIGQFEDAGAPKKGEKTVHGLKVHTVDISGTYLASGGPMMQSQAKKPGYRLLGAIVEGPQGNVFFKCTGPAATIAKAQADFDSLVGSVGKAPRRSRTRWCVLFLSRRSALRAGGPRREGFSLSAGFSAGGARGAALGGLRREGGAIAPSPGRSPSRLHGSGSQHFCYLCGVEVPNATPFSTEARARRRSTLLTAMGRERGEGKVPLPEDAAEITKLSGVEAVFGTDLLAEHLARTLQRRAPLTAWVPLFPAEGFAESRDLALRRVADLASDPFEGGGSRSGGFAARLRDRFPNLGVADLSPVLDNLRLIKSPREIAVIRKATRLSGLALIESMRSTRPGQYERELDGLAKFIFYRNGAQGDAYYSLIASGRNAWYPHYNAGKRKMEDGDFLLMDYAPDYGYYMSDVTRIWPVNGKFSQWQRDLYGFYLGCYRAILKAIRPADGGRASWRTRRRRWTGFFPQRFSKETSQGGGGVAGLPRGGRGPGRSGTGSGWRRTTTGRTPGRSRPGWCSRSSRRCGCRRRRSTCGWKTSSSSGRSRRRSCPRSCRRTSRRSRRRWRSEDC
jgi:Xaa-Pro aminopeptidase